MFTGLVQAKGRVETVETRGEGVRLVIRPQGWEHRVAPSRRGDSICVSGCCLTVAEAPARTAGALAFDVVPETLARTTLGRWREGTGVNLERSLAAGDLMGGHIVQGHVDGVGVVERVETGAEHRVVVRPPGELMEFAVPKGSVGVDGVSLTLARVAPGGGGGVFEVALIPTTLRLTTLGDLREGDACNLEMDVIAKTVVHWMRHYGGAEGHRGRGAEQ